MLAHKANEPTQTHFILKVANLELNVFPRLPGLEKDLAVCDEFPVCQSAFAFHGIHSSAHFDEETTFRPNYVCSAYQ